MRCDFNLNASVAVLRATWRKRFLNYLKDIKEHDVDEERRGVASDLISKVCKPLHCTAQVNLCIVDSKIYATPEGSVPNRSVGVVLA